MLLESKSDDILLEDAVFHRDDRRVEVEDRLGSRSNFASLGLQGVTGVTRDNPSRDIGTSTENFRREFCCSTVLKLSFQHRRTYMLRIRQICHISFNY